MQNLKKIVKKILIDLEMSDTDLAEVIGMTKANLSYHFNKADISPKLYKEIIDALVVKKGLNPEISPSQNYTVHDESFQKYNEDEGMQGNFIGEPREYNYNGITSSILERIIKPYEDLIEILKLQIADKEKRIKELEEKLTNKKKRCTVKTAIIFVVMFFSVGFAQSKDVTKKVKEIFNSNAIVKYSTEVDFAFISPDKHLNVVMRFKDETNPKYIGRSNIELAQIQVLNGQSYFAPFFTSANIMLEKFPTIHGYKMFWGPFTKRDIIITPKDINDLRGMGMEKETIKKIDWKGIRESVSDVFYWETRYNLSDYVNAGLISKEQYFNVFRKGFPVNQNNYLGYFEVQEKIDSMLTLLDFHKKDRKNP